MVCSSGTAYTVQVGDTLYLIADRLLGNGNRWAEIKNPDGSSPDPARLQPDQQLCIPGSAPPPPPQGSGFASIVSRQTIAFQTALWFWMTAQPPKPSCHAVMSGGWTPSPDDASKGRIPGFGMTINIINGGLECSIPTNAKVEDRVGFYQRFCQMLGVSMGESIYCDRMAHY